MAGVAVAFAVALIWSVASLRLGPLLGFVDAPSNELKIHETPTPVLGGVGVFAGLQLGLVVEDAFSSALFVASLLVLGLGLADDRLDLPPKLRLAAELGAATVLVAMMDLSIGMSVVGVITVVVAINAVNLLDGLDGLVGSVTVVSALGLAWAAANDLVVPALGATLAAATLGFLMLNKPGARIFLGDNGAYMIGLTLAYGALTAAPLGTGQFVLITVAVLGVFCLDLGVTILRRRLAGKELFAGDRSHIYDQLRDKGWPVPRIDLAAATAQAAFVAVLVGLALAEPADAISFTAVVAIATGSVATLWKMGFIRNG